MTTWSLLATRTRMNGHIVLRVELQSSMEAVHIYLNFSTWLREKSNNNISKRRLEGQTARNMWLSNVLVEEQIFFFFNTSTVFLFRRQMFKNTEVHLRTPTCGPQVLGTATSLKHSECKSECYRKKKPTWKKTTTSHKESNYLSQNKLSTFRSVQSLPKSVQLFNLPWPSSHCLLPPWKSQEQKTEIKKPQLCW